jgi:hypothetical protein
MTLLRLARLSDAPPPARELLEVADDGVLTGWRSQGTAVGHFGGSVDDIDGLRTLVEGAVAMPVPELGTLPLDATIESLWARDRSARFSVHATPGGPWGVLLRAARSLLDDTLPLAPVAAVALVVDEQAGVRLEHRGSSSITVELGSAWVEITRWRDGAPVGDAETRDFGLGRVEAGPGWTASIAVGIPGGEPGDLLTASAWFVADDAGVYVPIVLTGRTTAR